MDKAGRWIEGKDHRARKYFKAVYMWKKQGKGYYIFAETKTAALFAIGAAA